MKGFGGPNVLMPGTYKNILHVAIHKDDCEAIGFLIAHPDIDVNVPEQYGPTPLMTAARNGRLEAVRLLLQHKDIEVNYRGGWRNWTALQYAKFVKHNEIVDLLLAHGAIDYDAEAPTTVPTTARIDNSQNITLQPEHETHSDLFENDMDDAAIESWLELFGTEERMEE
ncbi:hypothetical protein J4E89_008816 [Alternaria sp. Ai002NY15]|nr:hypothetical protein J4E89_008816 [Alternaria sp. Ai002NY15]